jgi:hypothetical protein
VNARVANQATSLPLGQHVGGSLRRYGTRLFLPVPDVRGVEAISVTAP